MFGLVAAELDDDDARLVFTWLFTVLIAAQGTIIFWFHLFQDREARQKLKLGRFFSSLGHLHSRTKKKRQNNRKQTAVQRGRNTQDWFKPTQPTPSGAAPANSTSPGGGSSLTPSSGCSALPPVYTHAPLFDPPSFDWSNASSDLPYQHRRSSSLPTFQTIISSENHAESTERTDGLARPASALARLSSSPPPSPQVGGGGGYIYADGSVDCSSNKGGEYITAYPASVLSRTSDSASSSGGSFTSRHPRDTVWRLSVAPTATLGRMPPGSPTFGSVASAATLDRMDGPAHFDEGAVFYGLDSIGAGSMRGVSVSGESWTPATILAAAGYQQLTDPSHREAGLTMSGAAEPDSIQIRNIQPFWSSSGSLTTVPGPRRPSIVSLEVFPSAAAIGSRRGSSVLPEAELERGLRQSSRRSSLV